MQVKEQSLSTLWNLSVEEKLCIKISNTDILPLAIKYLDDEDIKVKEAAGGILANLALSRVNHSIMVEAGVIPKLVRHPLSLVIDICIMIYELYIPVKMNFAREKKIIPGFACRTLRSGLCIYSTKIRASPEISWAPGEKINRALFNILKRKYIVYKKIDTYLNMIFYYIE